MMIRMNVRVLVGAVGAVAVTALAGRRPPPQEAPAQLLGMTASDEGSVAIGGDNAGVASAGDHSTNTVIRAQASGNGRVHQAGGGGQAIHER